MRTDDKRTAERNLKLYDKMSAEQVKYQEWLITLSPAEVLHHAYEYSVQEDILRCLEDKDLTEAQAEALLKSPCPLDDVYKAWKKQDPGYMENLWATMENRADEVIQREQQRSRSEGAR